MLLAVLIRFSAVATQLNPSGCHRHIHVHGDHRGWECSWPEGVVTHTSRLQFLLAMPGQSDMDAFGNIAG